MPTSRTINGKKIWIGRVDKKYGPPYTKRFKTKQEAIAWEQMRKKQYDEKIRTGITCGDWANEFLDNVQARDIGMYDRYHLTLKRFFQDVDRNKRVSDLTARDFQKHLDRIATEISRAAANKARTLLATAYKYGLDFLGFQGSNLVKKVKPYKYAKKKRYVPSEEDFWKLVRTAKSKQHKLLLLTYFYTAARKNELLTLTWDDVDFEKGLINLATKKRIGGEEPAWIPLAQPLRKPLMEWKIQTQAIAPQIKVDGQWLTYVFFNEHTGQPLKSMRHFMPDLCEEAGVQPFGFHAIRHLIAITLYKEGESIATIQQILRHESPSTTEHYLASLGVLQLARPALDRLSETRTDKLKKALAGT